MAAAETPLHVAIATLLSIPVDTVRSRLFRARIALAKLCADEAAKELTPDE
jgi:DNA-directed RNA polymerase specialized sigma24 family protein